MLMLIMLGLYIGLFISTILYLQKLRIKRKTLQIRKKRSSTQGKFNKNSNDKRKY